MSCSIESNPFDQEWKAGDAEEVKVRYLNPDRTPIVIQSARMQLRKKISSPTADLEIAGVWDSITGEITFPALPADTTALSTSTKNNYVYDVEVTITATEIKTLGNGKITVTADITRD